MIASCRRPALGRVLLLTALVTATSACGGDADEQDQAATGTSTPSPAADATGSPSATPPPSPGTTPRSRSQGVISREDFGIAWSVEIAELNGEWCMTARAEGDSQEICGDEVALNEVHGGRENVSVVEFSVGTLDITAGLVVEGVTRVRVETEPPPENPGGPGTMEEVEPRDALEGLNAYAEADQDPTPGAGDDLKTQRVVAFDLTGDKVDEVEPTSPR